MFARLSRPSRILCALFAMRSFSFLFQGARHAWKRVERKQRLNSHPERARQFHPQLQTGAVIAPFQIADGLGVHAQHLSQLLSTEARFNSEEHNAIVHNMSFNRSTNCCQYTTKRLVIIRSRDRIPSEVTGSRLALNQSVLKRKMSGASLWNATVQINAPGGSSNYPDRQPQGRQLPGQLT